MQARCEITTWYQYICQGPMSGRDVDCTQSHHCLCGIITGGKLDVIVARVPIYSFIDSDATAVCSLLDLG